MSTALLLPENSVVIVRGASKTLALSVVQADSGAPVDLTGGLVYFTVKALITDPVPLILKTSNSSSEILITNPRGGLAQVYLVPADTRFRDAPCSYLFDVWVQLASGARYPVVGPSTFMIQPGVTVLQ